MVLCRGKCLCHGMFGRSIQRACAPFDVKPERCIRAPVAGGVEFPLVAKFLTVIGRIAHVHSRFLGVALLTSSALPAAHVSAQRAREAKAFNASQTTPCTISPFEVQEPARACPSWQKLRASCVQPPYTVSPSAEPPNPKSSPVPFSFWLFFFSVSRMEQKRLRSSVPDAA